MPDPRSRRIEVHTLLFGERFNRAVLLQVRFILILDVMVERERKLLRILLSCVMQRCGRIDRKSPVRSGRAGPSAMCFCAIFSTTV
jgi:hypothetical protein